MLLVVTITTSFLIMFLLLFSNFWTFNGQICRQRNSRAKFHFNSIDFCRGLLSIGTNTNRSVPSNRHLNFGISNLPPRPRRLNATRSMGNYGLSGRFRLVTLNNFGRFFRLLNTMVTYRRHLQLKTICLIRQITNSRISTRNMFRHLIGVNIRSRSENIFRHFHFIRVGTLGLTQLRPYRHCTRQFGMKGSILFRVRTVKQMNDFHCNYTRRFRPMPRVITRYRVKTRFKHLALKGHRILSHFYRRFFNTFLITLSKRSYTSPQLTTFTHQIYMARRSMVGSIFLL